MVKWSVSVPGAVYLTSHTVADKMNYVQIDNSINYVLGINRHTSAIGT